MAFTWDGGSGTTPGVGTFEGWDEFPQYGFPGSYQFSWDNTPWIENPLSLRGQETNPLPDMDGWNNLNYDAEARNALLNSGYDPSMASLNHQPQYKNLDISRYRYDPYGGYMQYQDKAGNTGYLMGGGRYLDEKNSLTTNLPNAVLPKWTDYTNNSKPQEYHQLGYDPYGGQSRSSQYKIKENSGQGWFSKNMDWLVPLVIGGVGGGMAASGVGMSSGATGAAAGGATGAAAGATGLASLPAAGTWAQTALPALGSTAGEWTLPAALAGAATPLAGATSGFGQTLADMFNNFGMDGAFNTPMTGGGAGSVPAEGASMFDEIFGGIGANGANMSLAPSAFGPEMDAILAGAQGGMSFPGIGGGILEAAGPVSDAFGLKDIWNLMNSPTGQLAKGALRLGSAAVGDQSAKRSNQQLQQYLQQQQAAADPFGPQRPYYQQELQKSYVDPLEIYNRPEYQGLKNIFEEGIRRRDAAKGRRVANEFPRAIELQDHFMKFLGDYRQGLQNPAGTTISPNNVGQLGQLFQSGLTNRYNALGNYSNALGSIFDPYANQKQQMTDKLTAFLNSLG